MWSRCLLVVALASTMTSGAQPSYSVTSTDRFRSALLEAGAAEWTSAASVTWGRAPYETTFRALWSTEGLCLRFDAADDHPWHTMTKHDDHLWEEEVVEIFLDINRSGREHDRDTRAGPERHPGTVQPETRNMCGQSRSDLLNPSGLGRVLLLSPHDDDGVVGCGGLIAAMAEPPMVVITSDGRLGYHSLAERDGFADQREREALSAYGSVGVPPEKIVFLRYPDMSVRNYQNWMTSNGQPGAYQTVFRILRSHRPDTMLVPSEFDFHPDHKVIAEVALVAAVQARESLMPELGPPVPIARLYAYQVWEPIAGVTHRFALESGLATRKRGAIRAFVSQLDAFARMHEAGTLRYDEERFALVRAFPVEPVSG